MRNKPLNHPECTAFNDEGEYIAKWMAAQREVKEESLTDSYLYRLSVAIPSIRYRSFTRWQESRRTGADWEWWLIWRQGAIRLRVQAKKLRDNRNIRGDLARASASGGQLAMLVADSISTGSLPVYVFFSSAVSTTLRCGIPGATGGVFIAPAYGIKRLVDAGNAIRPKDVLAMSRKAACLACCLDGLDASKSKIRISEWFLGSDSSGADEKKPQIWWYEPNSIPDYVEWARSAPISNDRTSYSQEIGITQKIRAVVVTDFTSHDPR